MQKWIAFWLVALMFGSGFMLVNIAVQEISPLELNTYRLFFGSALLLVVLRMTGRSIPLDRHSLLALTVIGMGNITLPFLLIGWAQQVGLPSGVAGVLVGTNPLFSLVLAHFIFEDERMNLPKVVGVVIGFIGVLILASRNFSGEAGTDNGFLPQIAVTLAALMFASMGIYSRHTMQNNVDALAMSAGTTLVGFLSSAVLLIFTGISNSPTDLSNNVWMSIGALAFFNSFIAFGLFYYVVKELGASRSALIAYVVPIVSLVMGSIFLNEIIDLRVIYRNCYHSD